MEWLENTFLWEELHTHLQRWLGLSETTAANLFYTFLVLLVYLLLRRGTKSLFLRGIDEPSRRYKFNKIITNLLGLFAALVIIKIWLLGRVNLTTYLGILSAGLVVALQDPITNFAGWMFILWRQPFKAGDRIQIGAHIGDVIDVRMFMFTILEVGHWVHADQSTGRIIYLPNGRVFKDPCANYTAGFDYIWNELPVTVTFESDWKRAHALLTEIVGEESQQTLSAAQQQLKRMAEEHRVLYRHLTPIVWVEIADAGVLLTMRYLCQVRQRRVSSDRIWRRLLDALAEEPRIDLAYPTNRVFQNAVEGKPGTGGPKKASLGLD